MKKFLVVISMLFAAQAFAADLASFDKLSGTVQIAGGTAHIPVMQAAAKNISAHNDKIVITVAGGGSGAGVKMVADGLVQIGNTGRALKDSEIKEFGLQTFPFAIDGVAVIVHPENPVKNLTTAQVIDIFNGKITNWKEIGGKDTGIDLYTREDGSGTREVFVDILLKKGAILPRAIIVNSNGAMKTAVSRNARGIGYVGIGSIDNTVKATDIDGITPTQENASSGVYKVTRLLYMNTKGAPEKLTKAFIEYITDSADGKKIIVEAGYIPLK
ncbi:MAG: phosphate ABC transporter substrate-binding protein [Deferribacteraceae bacterium]|jgi:phosphate transport system substrate-binding protein|nr:phosphate ABC transporter substrate-binding protein [Deferribacteraceae bacterium]